MATTIWCRFESPWIMWFWCAIRIMSSTNHQRIEGLSAAIPLRFEKGFKSQFPRLKVQSEPLCTAIVAPKLVCDPVAVFAWSQCIQSWFERAPKAQPHIATIACCDPIFHPLSLLLGRDPCGDRILRSCLQKGPLWRAPRQHLPTLWRPAWATRPEIPEKIK